MSYPRAQAANDRLQPNEGDSSDAGGRLVVGAGPTGPLHDDLLLEGRPARLDTLRRSPRRLVAAVVQRIVAIYLKPWQAMNAGARAEIVA